MSVLNLNPSQLLRSHRNAYQIAAPMATITVDKLKEVQQGLQEELVFLQGRMKTYYDQSRLQGPTFTKGDKVYLLRKNIKTKRPNDKLDFKKIGPFKIEGVISATNYKLSLPNNMRIHPVFHISLLEPAPKNAQIETNLEVETDQHTYEVETILDKRRVGKG